MFKNIVVFFALFVSSTAFASQCDDKFPNGKEVKVPNTTVLCNTFYATVFDEAHNIGTESIILRYFSLIQILVMILCYR